MPDSSEYSQNDPPPTRPAHANLPASTPSPASPPISADSDAGILDEVEYILYQASAWKRLANYLIDWIVLYVVAHWTVRFVFIMHLPIRDTSLFPLAMYTIILIQYGLFIAGLEGLTAGKTIGKYITRTRAVNADGTRITGLTALLRFLVREVPFAPLSALGDPSYPWHDRWTKTVVIDEQLTTLPPED